MAKTISKLKSSKGVDKLPAASARPGAWKTMLVDKVESPTNPTQESLEGKASRSEKEVPPIIQDAIITDIANGIPQADIERTYAVSAGYARSVMQRRFGSREAMKKALTLMCYENACAFMGYAAEHMNEMTAGQAVVAAKMSIDAGVTLEKSERDVPDEIDIGGLIALGTVLGRLEKRITAVEI